MNGDSIHDDIAIHVHICDGTNMLSCNRVQTVWCVPGSEKALGCEVTVSGIRGSVSWWTYCILSSCAAASCSDGHPTKTELTLKSVKGSVTLVLAIWASPLPVPVYGYISFFNRQTQKNPSSCHRSAQISTSVPSFVLCLWKTVCVGVIFSASLGLCLLESVGDGTHLLQANRGRQLCAQRHMHTLAYTCTETHKQMGLVQWMYSSVKKHQVCVWVNTASSACHMDRSPVT